MKPFHFPLQAVLTVRLNQEKKSLEAFAAAQSELEKAAARFQQVQSEIMGVFGRRRNAMERSASSENLQQMQHGLRALQESERRCRAELEKAQARVDEKSRALLDARQKREVVERIYDKQLAGHHARAARAEQKLADELAALKSMGNLALKWR